MECMANQFDQSQQTKGSSASRSLSGEVAEVYDSSGIASASTRRRPPRNRNIVMKTMVKCMMASGLVWYRNEIFWVRNLANHMGMNTKSTGRLAKPRCSAPADQ